MIGPMLVGIGQRVLNDLYTVKKGLSFPSPAGMSLTRLSLDGSNLIIPVQREFGNNIFLQC
jgi:hypothetical protein